MIDGINPIYATGYLKLDDCLYIFFFDASFVSCVLVKQTKQLKHYLRNCVFFSPSSLNQNSVDV